MRNLYRGLRVVFGWENVCAVAACLWECLCLFNGTALLPTSRSTFRRSLFLWNVDWCAWASRSTSLKTAGLCNVPTSAYWQVISTGFLSKQIKYNVTVLWKVKLRVRFTTEKRVLAVMSLVYLWTFWKTFLTSFLPLKTRFWIHNL